MWGATARGTKEWAAIRPPAASPCRSTSHSSYAGLVSRFAALALDVALLTAACLAVSVLPSLAWEEVLDESPGWLDAVSGAVAAALPWAYFTLSWWLTGQTPGDVAFGIVVRRRDGESLSLPQSALRALVGLILHPIWLIGMIAVLWDERRRAWHDLLFRTVVCYTPKTQSASPAHAHNDRLRRSPRTRRLRDDLIDPAGQGEIAVWSRRPRSGSRR